ncbi:WapI family immunity protein [Delftia acidovorans]
MEPFLISIQTNMLTIDFDDFKFDIVPTSRSIEEDGVPYRDWLTLNVKITDGNFSGSVQWLTMPAEIKKFQQDLSQAYQSLIAGHFDIDPVQLSGIEPQFLLAIRVANAWGHLFAQYTMKGSPDGPELKGSFGLDQSFLPEWIRDLDELLEFRGH